MNSNLENGNLGNQCEFQSNIRMVREIYFFSGLPIDVIKVIAYLCIREYFQAEQYLFRQKDDDGRAFLIISGEVKLIFESESGEMDIRSYSEKTFIGGLSLMANFPRLFSLKAMTETRCLVISREVFQKTIEKMPSIYSQFMKIVAEEVIKWERNIMKDYGNDLKAYEHHIGLSLL